MAGKETILISEERIARRVDELASEIAALSVKPDIAIPILAGAFVFAADLLRALARNGLVLPVAFIWMRSYGNAETQGEVVTVVPPPNLTGRDVLLIDGVLDSGRTLRYAQTLLSRANARSIVSVVAVAKDHPQRSIEADFAGFNVGREFLYGYGMDRRGTGRGLPDIRIEEAD
jgi:hypoxanthine phosphoribosyltransferase